MHPFVEHFIKSIGKDTPMTLEGIFSAFIMCGTFNHEWVKLVREQYGFDFGPFVVVIEGTHCTVAFSRTSYYRTVRVGFEKFKEKGKEMPLVKDFKKAWRDSDSLVEKFPIDSVPNMKSEQLRALLPHMFNLSKIILSTTIFSEMLDEGEVKKMFVDAEGKEKDFNEFFRISSSPTFESVALRIDQMLIGKMSLREAQSFSSNYFITPPLEEIEKKREALITERGGVSAIKKEIEHIRNELIANNKEVNDYRPTLSQKLQKVFDYVQLCMYTRDIRRLPYNKLGSLASDMARELCKRDGIAKNFAPYFFPWELARGPIPDVLKKEVEKRARNGFICFLNTEGVTVEYKDVDAVRAQLFALVDIEENTGELRGSIAYRGFVKGMIQIIASEKDFPAFKRGNILVTSMTRPEFVPLMKMASAVITDEGGVTCHAAIVSRELKLPCITGTKNATRVLKNGDMVEVDAEKGIVKILKSSK